MATFLDELLDGARARVDAARTREPLEAVRSRAEAMPSPPSFRAALAAPGVQIVAEVKRASPSRGDLAPDLDAAGQARAYRDGGAAAVSVLTEPERFKGTLTDLEAVARLAVPTLRKDFVVDPYQVWEARAFGASAVLLIVSALDDDRLRELVRTCAAAGVDALVEVHGAGEVGRALAVGARLIGVNARDLRTFEVDRDAFARLRPSIPGYVLTIAESGVSGAEDVRAAGDAGADAVLVGESLVTAEDPTAAVAALVEAGAER